MDHFLITSSHERCAGMSDIHRFSPWNGPGMESISLLPPSTTLSSSGTRRSCQVPTRTFSELLDESEPLQTESSSWTLFEVVTRPLSRPVLSFLSLDELKHYCFQGISFDPIGKYLASQSADKTVRLWKMDSWTVDTTITEPFEEVYPDYTFLFPTESPHSLLGSYVWMKRITIRSLE